MAQANLEPSRFSKNPASQAFDLVILQKRNSANSFEIAVRLLFMYKNGTYKKGGFKNIADYAANVLDFKRNTTYKYIKVAEKFLEPTKEGKYISVLKKDYGDYTISQLIELASLPFETVMVLNNNGLITPYMTTKQIREVVKNTM